MNSKLSVNESLAQCLTFELLCKFRLCLIHTEIKSLAWFPRRKERSGRTKLLSTNLLNFTLRREVQIKQKPSLGTIKDDYQCWLHLFPCLIYWKTVITSASDQSLLLLLETSNVKPEWDCVSDASQTLPPQDNLICKWHGVKRRDSPSNQALPSSSRS